MKEINSILLPLIMLGAAATGLAQTGNPSGNATERRTAVRSDAGIAPVVPSMFEPITTGNLLDDQLVKNKPVAAVFESETVEMSATGGQTTRRTTTKIYRDSEGRTRREQVFSSGGAASLANATIAPITIYDPVAGYGYSINPAARIVNRYKLPSAPPQGSPFNDRAPLNVEILRNDNPQTGTVRRYRLEPPRVEALGRQQIAGIEAEGRRVTIKVPAGAAGNAGETETVHETWIARDLRMLIKSSTRNPGIGEHTLRLTTINRAEPTRALFEVPADYALTDMGAERIDVPPPF